MHPNNFIPGGGDPNIDEMLRQSFLDLDQNNPANDQLFDATSSDVFGKEWPVQLNAQKEAQLFNATKGAGKWTWYIAGVFATGIITTAVILYTKNSGSTTNTSENKNNSSNEKNITLNAANNISGNNQKNSPLNYYNSNANEKQENNTSQNNAIAENNKKNGVGVLTSQLNSNTQLNSRNKNKDSNIAEKTIVNNSNFINSESIDKNTVENPGITETKETPTESIEKIEPGVTIPAGKETMPGLSAAKIEETKRGKQRLVQEITGSLELFYAHVAGPSGGGYNKQVNQTSFYLRTTEVSVKDYKLFLSDLLMNKDFESYEKARPKYEEMFKDKQNADDKKFFDNYFSLNKYAYRPMVFITPEGAQMYCEWLQNLIINNSNGKFSRSIVRLPNESEWEKAAMAGKPNTKYATRKGKIKYLFGGYKANFRATQENNFGFVNPVETTEEIISDVDSSMTKNPGSKEKSKTQKNHFTCDVNDYEPNELGFYNMSGNVSELVKDSKGKIITKGGNWNSSVEFLQIKDFNEGLGVTASPYIGFRPVIFFK